MKSYFRTICLIALFAAITVSCRQLYTTSFGTALARDGLSISGSTSINDLLDIANSSDGASPEAAKELLDVFSGKSEADILALSIDDKTTILNLAGTAAIDFGTLKDIVSEDDSETSDDDLIDNALNSFDTSVDLTAIMYVLGDTETIDTAPIDTIVFASAVVLADLADSIGTDNVTILMDGGTVEGLTAAQQAQANLILNVNDRLSDRPDAGDADLGGFNLIDLLQGTSNP